MHSEKQYEIFKKWFEIYYEMFGLFQWELYDRGLQKDLIEFPLGGAKVEIDRIQRCVKYSFYAYDGEITEEELRGYALHEILHILLDPLGQSPTIHHEIINVLMRVYRPIVEGK